MFKLKKYKKKITEKVCHDGGKKKEQPQKQV